jgi:hypothetical protein
MKTAFAALASVDQSYARNANAPAVDALIKLDEAGQGITFH